MDDPVASRENPPDPVQRAVWNPWIRSIASRLTTFMTQRVRCCIDRRRRLSTPQRVGIEKFFTMSSKASADLSASQARIDAKMGEVRHAREFFLLTS